MPCMPWSCIDVDTTPQFLSQPTTESIIVIVNKNAAGVSTGKQSPEKCTRDQRPIFFSLLFLLHTPTLTLATCQTFDTGRHPRHRDREQGPLDCHLQSIPSQVGHPLDPAVQCIVMRTSDRYFNMPEIYSYLSGPPFLTPLEDGDQSIQAGYKRMSKNGTPLDMCLRDMAKGGVLIGGVRVSDTSDEDIDGDNVGKVLY